MYIGKQNQMSIIAQTLRLHVIPDFSILYHSKEQNIHSNEPAANYFNQTKQL